MNWKVTPIAAAAVLGAMASMPRPAAAQSLGEITGAARDTVGIICQFTDCRGGGRQPQPQQQQVIIQQRAPSQPAMSAEQRRRLEAERAQRAAEQAQNVAVQSALNGFGFDVGAADGDLGPRSRAAIADYQAYMGYPASGYLDDNQRAILLNSDRRLRDGEGSRYPRVVAAEGTRGLLRAFNDPGYIGRYGVAPDATPAPGGQPAHPGDVATNGYPPAAPVPPAAQPRQGGGAPGAAAGGPLELPPLEMAGGATVSMANRCEIVELTTASNQGPIQVTNMSDPAQALSEQFCEARSYAIGVSENTAARIRASEAQLVTACEQISAGMAPVRATLATATPEAAAAQAATVSEKLDASSAATYGQICLGLGYRRDDPEMALSAGLLLVGAGYTPFGEVLGHHLREGFGVAPATGAALPWYNSALTALDANATPAFLPSKTQERMAVIRAAVESGQIRASGPAPVPGLVPISQPVAGGVVVSE